MLQLSEGETFQPIGNTENPIYPVIHRQYIYFLSSKETKEKFMKNPIKYIRQPKPKPTMPVRIIIVGPPKSGKTTGEYFCFLPACKDPLNTSATSFRNQISKLTQKEMENLSRPITIKETCNHLLIAVTNT